MTRNAPAHGAAHGETSPPAGRRLALLSLGALGIVYGDIGTSPLYALRECFHEGHGLAVTPPNVLGVLSLVTWSLLLVVTVKYLLYVLRADNRGEGGILALMALVPGTKRGRLVLVAMGLFGAALLYGDGMITPAISVLSAVEGLGIATHAFDRYVLPITVAILIGLFSLQKRGTAGIAALFGPVMCAWFAMLAGLGIYGIVREPSVLGALNPWHAVDFFVREGQTGFMVLGAVVLVVTGGESLYADMGHFGRLPIRWAWFAVVLPSLLLNYLGQGAAVLHDAATIRHPFFLMAPRWLLIPMVALSTVAAVIASQALISGVFSLTRQAVQLGFLPRMRIDHTSADEIGQIYVPGMNWMLMLAAIGLVLGFRSSSNLAAAYGIAVTATMMITTWMAYFVAREVWGWRVVTALPLTLGFFCIEVSFFGANVFKIPDGGWFPLAVGAGIFTLMTTWRRGRAILADRLGSGTLPLRDFLQDLGANPVHRIPGTAVFMTSNVDGTPPVLLHHILHNRVLHEQVVLLTILTREVPHVKPADRLQVTALKEGFFQVVATYGFMDTPNVPVLLAACARESLRIEPQRTTYYLGRETLIATDRPGMALWRERLFAFMSRNAMRATQFFGIPPNRVVELGVQVEL